MAPESTFSDALTSEVKRYCTKTNTGSEIDI